ncbi:MAG: transposase [Bacteroidetes bacterium]|nr:transposase [Bacteroidota bacterium]
MKTRYAKRMKIQRSSTVEPVLGTLINFTGMRRIWTRGISNANKFVLGAAIAYNLKKWLKWQDINKSLKKNASKVAKTQGNEQNADLLNAFNTPKNRKLAFLIFLN